MIWFTDGKNEVGIEMREIDREGNYLPDWTEDFFNVGILTYNEDRDAYNLPYLATLEDFVKAAEEWENYETDEDCAKEYDKARGYGRFVKITGEEIKPEMNTLDYKNIAKRLIVEKMEDVLEEEKPWALITYENISEDVDGRNAGQLVGIIEYYDGKEDSNMVRPFDIVVPEYGEVLVVGYKDTDIPYNGYDGNYPLWYEVDSEETIDKDNLRKKFAQNLIDDDDGEYDNTTLDEWIDDMEEIDMIRRIW